MINDYQTDYINLKEGLDLNYYSLEEILTNHTNIVSKLLQHIRPLKFLKEYIEFGAYPYFLEGTVSYHQRLVEILNQTLREDIATIYNVKPENIEALQKILELICASEPYEINYEKISSLANISKNTLKQYLYYLEKGSLARRIGGKIRGNQYISKPDKLYLHNTNLFEILCDDAKVGIKREVFFAQSLYNHNLTYPKKGDFLVDSKYTFLLTSLRDSVTLHEIGGKNKSFKQIADMPNSFVVADDIEVGFGNKVPLWLFGFLY